MAKQTSNKYVSREKLEKELKKKYGNGHDFKIVVSCRRSSDEGRSSLPPSRRMRAYLGKHRMRRNYQR